MQIPGNVEDLLLKYLNKTISPLEKQILEAWIDSAAKNEKWFAQLTNENWRLAELRKIYAIDETNAWSRIAETLEQEVDIPIVRRRNSWRWWQLGVAASILIILSVIGFKIWKEVRSGRGPVQQLVEAGLNEVTAPTKSRAVVTLADGSAVYLDSLASDASLVSGGARIIKKMNGEIEYRTESGSDSVALNTLFNPRGSIAINLRLSDGTKVWLNSETTLVYPTIFSGRERLVQVTGEAYFEVAVNPSKPFKVQSGGLEIEVLGTHFNVNAYPDETGVETTLLEGSVKLTAKNESVQIKPRQQAHYLAGNNRSFNIQSDVEVYKVIAWKEGMFQFDNTTLPVIMRQIGRWYNKDILYEGPPGTDTFGGSIRREVPLSNVLKLLEATGVHFKLEGNNLIVKP